MFTIYMSTFTCVYSIYTCTIYTCVAHKWHWYTAHIQLYTPNTCILYRIININSSHTTHITLHTQYTWPIHYVPHHIYIRHTYLKAPMCCHSSPPFMWDLRVSSLYSIAGAKYLTLQLSSPDRHEPFLLTSTTTVCVGAHRWRPGQVPWGHCSKRNTNKLDKAKCSAPPPWGYLPIVSQASPSGSPWLLSWICPQ